MAERKPRFVVDDKDCLVLDTESLAYTNSAYPDGGEIVAAAIDESWARIITDALNRTTQ